MDADHSPGDIAQPFQRIRERSPRPAVEPSAEMSIEILSKRHLSVFPLLDPQTSIANDVIRRIGAGAGPCSTSSR